MKSDESKESIFFYWLVKKRFPILGPTREMSLRVGKEFKK